MWAARNKDGSVNVFRGKPIRIENEWVWDLDRSKTFNWWPLNNDTFPELKWEDEPVEIDDLYFGIYLW